MISQELIDQCVFFVISIRIFFQNRTSTELQPTPAPTPQLYFASGRSGENPPLGVEGY